MRALTHLMSDIIKREGNSLYVVPQGPGSMNMAGAGERQLWSMLAAMGPMQPEAAKSWMEGFIPDTKLKPGKDNED